jgi:hypothetical protein
MAHSSKLVRFYRKPACDLKHDQDDQIRNDFVIPAIYRNHASIDWGSFLKPTRLSGLSMA